MFLRNAWYVAAVDEELGDSPLARKILGEDVVLWRRPEGTPAAIEDRCCHRHLPLSMGRIDGANLRCGYHGYLFDGAGKVVEIPGIDNIPEKAAVKSYPVVERWRYVWIWMGEAALADPSKIPNVFWADHPQWRLSMYMPEHLKCNFQLVCDNVLDVTHLTYVHPTTIGAMSLTEFEPTIELTGDMVSVTRWILDRPAPPAYAKAGGFPGNADRLARIEYRVPNYCVNYANLYDKGFGGPTGDSAASPHKVELVAISLPTPETENTCHYFFCFARTFGFNDPEIEAFFARGMLKVFQEDFPVLEAQQARMDAYPGATQIDTRNDAGVNRSHRLLDQYLRAENDARSSAA